MLAKIAMGIQSSAVRALGLPHISTTYITGTWTNLIISLIRQQTTKTLTDNDERKSGLLLSIGVIIIYILSAIVGGFSVANLSLMADYYTCDWYNNCDCRKGSNLHINSKFINLK